SVATYKWYLKPNFDIDKEMGYKYDVDINGKNINYAEHGTFLNEATTNTNYNNNNRQGFDPYNLRIQNVSTETYFTTNAKEYGNYAYAATYPLEGMKVTLTDATATVDAAGYESTETLKISNATFFAVQDANGNMRLMPRFDTDHVIEGFTALAQQAEAQSASDQSHAQTTLLYTPITYHIIDNSGADVFGALTHNGAGFAVAREYKSPMVAEYYFHASLADATNSRTASTKTSFAAGDVIYVSYKATDDFLDATKAWIIYGNKNYMHAVYRNGESSDGQYARLWWMSRQHQEKDNNAASFTLTTMPFLSNAFAWQVGENADPYNATFLNKGAHRYMDQSTDGSNYQMGHLKYTSETPTSFAILYQSASGDDCVLYNRTKSKFVYSSDNNNDWRAGDSRSNTEYRLSITTLPQISINVVDAAGEVECSMEGYYKSGCTWDNSFTPFILERMYTSDHTFYYDKSLSDAVSGTVDDAKVLAKDSVFVKYTLDTSSWGVVDNTANTLKVMPSPNASNKINWYAVKVVGPSNQWFKAATTDLPSNLGNTSNTTATSTADENANKLAHWAFIGTPYNLKIVERYHGMFDYLGLSENAVDDDFAFIDDGTADITTWEVVTNVSGNTNIQIRPQRSLNGETPYLYLGWNGGRNNMSMGAGTNGNYALNLTWVKETDAKAVTFKLYDSAGNAMSLNETALTAEIVGVTDNANWANLFNTTDLPRQYCTYTFYSDNAFTTSITTDDGTGYDAYNHKDIYVKWDYTEHAPVFSQGTDTTKYQYYVFANRATNNGYTTYTPDGGTMITGGEYTPNADTKVGVGEYVDNKNSHWAFVGNPYNFALYNRVGKYLKLAEGATIANNQNVDFTATAGDALSWCLPAVDWTDENQTLSDRVDRTADAFRLFYPKINGYNVGIGNTRLNAGSDNIQWGFKRIEYIVVPLTVYDSNMTVKDTQEYSVPYPETDGHVINGDKMIRGTYHTPNLKHGFCDYTYYDTYTAGSPATLSGEMPSGGFNVCGGTEQKKKEVYATYTVDEEMFLQPWLTYNITDGTKQHYSRISDYQVQQSVQTTATAARQDATKRYQWVFKGDPYNFQIANVSMDETEPTAQYPLGAKATGWADNQNLYLHVTNDVSTYHYNTFEIVEA
ncbi:MAG: hypothetical protein J6Z41_05270, partial [Prevotella sp.]|nr:hypothetical protein [Prevotella sp.]